MEKTCPNCRLINAEFAERCDCGYDFASGSLEGAEARRLAPAELPALPRMWIGYLFVAAFLAAEIVIDPTATVGPWPPRFAFALAGLGYWLYCVYRIHVVLGAATDGRYPIAPGTAVVSHFIPFYNLYWVFKWPNEIAGFINVRRPGKGVRGVVGLLLLFGHLLGRWDGSLGMVVIFSTGMYITSSIASALHPEPESDRRHRPWKYAAIGCGGLVVLVVAALMVLGSFVPETGVVSGKQLRADYASVVRELELLDQDEEIVLWYSDRSFRGEGRATS